VTARGRGTATTGASVPSAGGMVLSLERMTRILEINTADRYARVEPGVLNGDLQLALAPLGFFWAPDPTSAPYSSIGGNLACNAGGPRTVKYGAARDNVLGLNVVDGAGRYWPTGQFTSKGSVGFDLTRLLVGSEGLLGVIVEATLKLLPKPTASRLMRASFQQVEAAAEAVARVMAQANTPSALEFMDAKALGLLRRYHALDLPQGDALLLLEVDGAANTIDSQAAAIQAACQVSGLLHFEQATDARQGEQLWAARKALSPTLRLHAPKKINEDVVVPVSQLPALIRGVYAISAEFGIEVVNFGHAGNGNVHVNFLYDPANADQHAAAPLAVRALFKLVLSLNGTLSGEHGIGLDKLPFMAEAIPAETLSRMRDLKRVFDPAGILNPGKVLPMP